MYTYQHEVKYYECDRMGITHHSNYVRFMEEARVDLLDRIGFGFDQVEAEGIVSPVISISCNYKHPTTFKDRIDIQTEVHLIGDLKFEFSYEMRVGDRLVCTAQSTHCFMEHNRPVVIAKRLPQLYQAICTNAEV